MDQKHQEQVLGVGERGKEVQGEGDRSDGSNEIQELGAGVV